MRTTARTAAFMPYNLEYVSSAVNQGIKNKTWESPPLVNTAIPLPLWAPRSINLAPGLSVILLGKKNTENLDTD